FCHIHNIALRGFCHIHNIALRGHFSIANNLHYLDTRILIHDIAYMVLKITLSILNSLTKNDDVLISNLYNFVEVQEGCEDIKIEDEDLSRVYTSTFYNAHLQYNLTD
ncbi:hypothetical protein ACJX0J_020936, partial [Zea mays]